MLGLWHYKITLTGSDQYTQDSAEGSLLTCGTCACVLSNHLQDIFPPGCVTAVRHQVLHVCISDRAECEHSLSTQPLISIYN